ncbi:putative endopeptidase, NLPC/P60 domain, LRAT-like domain protein, partial [Tanacetum coccineum]
TYGGNSKSARNTPIIDKTDKLERQILDGKLMFMDDDGNLLVATGNVDSENDVEVVFDETTNLMASMRFKGGSDKGYGINSLLKQWRETKRDDDYDPYDDDLFESIFVGEGKIIHFVSTIRDYEGSRFLAPLKILSGSSTSHHKEKSPCSVSYCGLEKARGGTCSMAKSDPLEDVMHRATYLYENGYGKYDLMNNNCEDFALYCKIDLWSTDKESQGRSSQANMVRPTRLLEFSMMGLYNHVSLYTNETKTI